MTAQGQPLAGRLTTRRSPAGGTPHFASEAHTCIKSAACTQCIDGFNGFDLLCVRPLHRGSGPLAGRRRLPKGNSSHTRNLKLASIRSSIHLPISLLSSRSLRRFAGCPRTTTLCRCWARACESPRRCASCCPSCR